MTAVDHAQNLLTVSRREAAAVTYDPRRLQGVTVYREAVRPFAVGDRLQFTGPVPTEKIANGELGTIAAISSQHDLRVRTDAGKTVTLPGDPAGQGPRAHRHVDDGYAVTSHSSQGLTADRVLLYIDSERGGGGSGTVASFAVQRPRRLSPTANAPLPLGFQWEVPPSGSPLL